MLSEQLFCISSSQLIFWPVVTLTCANLGHFAPVSLPGSGSKLFLIVPRVLIRLSLNRKHALDRAFATLKHSPRWVMVVYQVFTSRIVLNIKQVARGSNDNGIMIELSTLGAFSANPVEFRTAGGCRTDDDAIAC